MTRIPDARRQHEQARPVVPVTLLDDGDLVPIQPLPATGHETGRDLGLESFATLADGSQIANPRIFRVAERKLTRAQCRVSRRKKGSHRRRKAVRLLAKAHQKVRRARVAFTTRWRSPWSGSTTPSTTKTCRRPTCSGITIWQSPSRTPAGVRSCPRVSEELTTTMTLCHSEATGALIVPHCGPNNPEPALREGVILRCTHMLSKGHENDQRSVQGSYTDVVNACGRRAPLFGTNVCESIEKSARRDESRP
jgi:Probable transposase